MPKVNDKLNFVDRYLHPSKYPVINNKDGSISTHRMADAEVDGKYIAYPTIILSKNGELQQLEDDEALNYAIKNGEYIEFKTQKEASEYATNGYKKDWGKGDYEDYLKAHQDGDIQKAFDIKIQSKLKNTDVSKW
jgi:hypothetical protein